ncbi:MAG TPA: PLP-dependent aminotransferase family protein [Chloroflexi bacterium]|nr:PLP-dependent aminotransferase family protein [Chloroflexota bacterium]
MSIQWSERYARRIKGMRSSIIRELLKLTQQPDIISFAGGLPAPELFPIERVMEASQRVLEQHGSQALQYSTTEGYPPLRELIVQRMQRYGIICTIDNVLITAGSQQALDLIGKVLIDPGDRLIVEEPTYLGAIQAWNTYQAGYTTVPTDDEGVRTDAVEEVLRADGAKFIYALPNFQNPSGITMSRRRREELVRLANEYDIPIIEDDPYGQLRYEGEHEPPLIVLDAGAHPENGSSGFITGDVIYLSTFSKTLAPGFRVAWMVGPEEVIQRMAQAKQGSDLHTGTFAQMVAYETARDGFLDEHVRKLRQVYKERRDLMLSLIEEHFPPGVTWTHPRGGLFLWVRLPEGMDTTALLKKAIENRVAFVPGSAFYPHGGGENTMRINFSNARPEQIREGIRRLAAVIEAEMEAASLT